MNGEMITNLAETRKGKVFQKPRMTQETEVSGIMRAASWPYNTCGGRAREGDDTTHMMRTRHGSLPSRIERQVQREGGNGYTMWVYMTEVLRKVRCYFHNKTLKSEWNTIHKKSS